MRELSHTNERITLKSMPSVAKSPIRLTLIMVGEDRGAGMILDLVPTL